MWDKLSIETICESSILVRFSDEIDTGLPQYINAVAEAIIAEQNSAVINITPSYTTLLIDYLPFKASEEEMLNTIATILHSMEYEPEHYHYNTIVLPVYYDESVAPDLSRILADKQLSKDDIISLHTSTEYTVCAIGYVPGFAFLSSLPQQLMTKRMAQPRPLIKKGSLAIADQQTAIYPLQSSGTWNIIGNCPVNLFSPDSEKLCPFRIGDKVRFESITKEDYFQFGGKLWDE